MPTGPSRAETRDRGSRFLALAAPAGSVESGLELQEEARARHHDATHHVLAVRVDGDRCRTDDDGEPGGTGGRPVLEAVDGAGLWRTAVVVVRWFGGTKLGTGGLARAYGGAAAEALEGIPSRLCLPGRRLRIRFPYGDTGEVMRLVSTGPYRRRGATYGEGTELLVDVPDLEAEGLVRALADATGGRAEVEATGDEVLVPADGASG